mmetsp:Transcript_8387/g.25887  ORF Transcript_8387/g.25887 Transcript_8387/m.25887 type:complete len:146 (+) Transcript_8387:50-487(+)
MLQRSLVVVAALAWLHGAAAFAPMTPAPPRTLRATPGVPLLAQKNAEDEGERPARITMQGLMELVTLGLGAPNLGKFKGVDKETGALNFELEANRIVDKSGKVFNGYDNSQNPYFEDAYVDDSADAVGNFMKMFQKKDDDKNKAK